MKILFLALHPVEAASTRYRICQYFPYFKQHGIDCELYTFFSSPVQRILYAKGHFLKKCYGVFSGYRSFRSLFGRLKTYDAFFISKEVLPFNQGPAVDALEKTGKPVIYDIDDAVFLGGSPARKKIFRMFEKPDSVNALMQISAQVIAGNKFLLDFSKQNNPNTICIPTSVDTKTYLPLPQAAHSGSVVLGWIGSHSTAPFLQSLNTVLKKLSSQYNVRLVVVGAKRTFPMEGVEVIHRAWELSEEMECFRSIDIGLYPIPENRWTLGKCGFKAIQYMALGIPCVASRAGDNSNIIADGKNGFLCSDAFEWERKLAFLIESLELRKKFSENGRKTVEEKFSIQANLPHYLNVFERLRHV